MRVQPGLSGRKQWKGSRAPVGCVWETPSCDLAAQPAVGLLYHVWGAVLYSPTMRRGSPSPACQQMKICWS